MPDVTPLRYVYDSGNTVGLSELQAGETISGASISNTPAGTIAANTVQAAINELDTEKASLAQADLAANTHAATSKVTPVDADEIPLADSAAAFGLKKLTWANLKAMFVAMFAAKGANSDITSLTGLSGNLSFTGTGNRITGDFSNATATNRLLVKTNAVNTQTSLGAIPNGTSTQSGFIAYNLEDPTNAAYTTAICNATEGSIRVGYGGSGSFLPLTFYIGGSEKFRIDTSGNTLVTSPAGLGYGTGAGGTVTQSTSKATSVTLNKPAGFITTSNSALAAGQSATFTLNNSVITTSDIIVVNSAGNANYNIECLGASGGSANIRITNITGGSLSEAFQINFAIIRGIGA